MSSAVSLSLSNNRNQPLGTSDFTAALQLAAKLPQAQASGNHFAGCTVPQVDNLLNAGDDKEAAAALAKGLSGATTSAQTLQIANSCGTDLDAIQQSAQAASETSTSVQTSNDALGSMELVAGSMASIACDIASLSSWNKG